MDFVGTMHSHRIHFLFEMEMKNFNKICREGDASRYYDKIHQSNNVEYIPGRGRGVLDDFVITYGVNKKYDNFNKKFHCGINAERYDFDLTICFTEE